MFFGELVETTELLGVAERRASWFESSAELFREIGREMTITGPSRHVLRYGIDLMEWNASWWRDVESRLSDEARSAKPS